VHAVSNVAALSLYGASLVARRRGAQRRGRLLGLAGAAALGVGGHLGGHLSYAKAVGVDATALGAGLDDWTDAGAAADLLDDVPVCRSVAGVDVLLVRHDGQVLALADRCSHRGGPLHEGTVEDGCVTCPLHGSRFRLSDGSVERGPSPYPQPTFAVRETAGRLEVRQAYGGPTL
jgi:nitrite reductase/ring-hydroxylating ferredoxin subunit